VANKLINMAVQTSDLGTQLIASTTQAGMRSVLGITEDGGVGSVDSVNGQTGTVVLGPADVGAAPVGANVSSFANDAGYITNADIPDAPVISVNGKSGVVTLNASEVGAVPTSAVGSTIATLVGGLVPNSQIPPLAITSTFVVSTQAAQLALAAQEGDVCVRTDQAQSYIKTNSNLGTMSDWQVLLSPTAPVQSVNGQTGVVNLTATNVGAAAAVHSHSDATTAVSGFMSAADKTKLNTIPQLSTATYVRASRSSGNIALTSGVTSGDIPFNLEQADVASEYNPSTGRTTVTAAGVYLLFVSCYLTGVTGSGNISIGVTPSGVGGAARVVTQLVSVDTMLSGTLVLNLSAGDSVGISVTSFATTASILADPSLTNMTLLRLR
jgi:hypothetical protein